jgi:hypothetical protein
MTDKNPPKADSPRANKIFFAVFFTLIAGVVIVTFTKYFIAKDYYIQAEADCDPATEACFVTTCDPADDPECPADPEEQTSYTKLVKKKANQIPDCDPADENCQALECLPGGDCEVIFCDEITVGEGQECNDPEEYNLENPVSKEESFDEAECAPDDQECLDAAGLPGEESDGGEDAGNLEEQAEKIDSAAVISGEMMDHTD